MQLPKIYVFYLIIGLFKYEKTKPLGQSEATQELNANLFTNNFIFEENFSWKESMTFS